MDLTDLLARDLDQATEQAPEPRPVETHLDAGRRALRRRRVVAVVGGVALVAAVAGAGWALGPGGAPSSDGGQVEVAEPPAPEGSGDPQWLDGRSVGLDPDGALVTAPGVEVLETVEDAAGGPPPDASTALRYRLDGTERWALLSLTRGPRDVVAFDHRETTADEAAGVGLGFRAWVRDEVELDASGDPPPLVRFEGETLVAEPGARILEQTSAVDLQNFAGPGDVAVAAAVQVGDRTWYVLARIFADGGPPQYIPVRSTPGTPTLADFLDQAAPLYDSGEGLL